MVNTAGRTGVPVRVDHSVETEVRDLFARVGTEAGRLDVLVNSVAGEDPRLPGINPWRNSTWTKACR